MEPISISINPYLMSADLRKTAHSQPGCGDDIIGNPETILCRCERTGLSKQKGNERAEWSQVFSVRGGVVPKQK